MLTKHIYRLTEYVQLKENLQGLSEYCPIALEIQVQVETPPPPIFCKQGQIFSAFFHAGDIFYLDEYFFCINLFKRFHMCSVHLGLALFDQSVQQGVVAVSRWDPNLSL